MQRLKSKLYDTKIDFVGKRKHAAVLSVILVVLSWVFFFTIGPNWGIDFTGGTEIHLRFDDSVGIAELRSALKGIGLEGLALGRFSNRCTPILATLDFVDGGDDLFHVGSVGCGGSDAGYVHDAGADGDGVHEATPRFGDSPGTSHLSEYFVSFILIHDAPHEFLFGTLGDTKEGNLVAHATTLAEGDGRSGSPILEGGLGDVVGNAYFANATNCLEVGGVISERAVGTLCG